MSRKTFAQIVLDAKRASGRQVWLIEQCEHTGSEWDDFRPVVSNAVHVASSADKAAEWQADHPLDDGEWYHVTELTVDAC